MAVDWDILKAQYLRGDRGTQLDSLALNLTRIQLLAQQDSNEPVAQHLIRESQFFIEWLVLGMDLDTDLVLATELVDLQRLLSRWKLGGSALWMDAQQRHNIALLAQDWCQRIQVRYKILTR
ncbi:MAG: hypothetical protein AAGG51_07635 [Cyanobacteria bacterium P01_G01_bin.54]